MSTHSVQSLTVDQQEAAAVLGQSFIKDTFMSYLFPHAETRLQQLTKLFLPIIRCSLRCGGVEISSNGGGVLLWTSEQALLGPLKVLEWTRSGLIWLPWSIGLSAFKRLYVHDAACERALKKNAPKNFAYLWVVGVRPDCAGQGLGKQLIQSAMNSMRQRGYSICFLRTENPKNIGLYEHLGFQQVYTATPSSSGLQYWLMSQTLKP